jgi:hypothetical protein
MNPVTIINEINRKNTGISPIIKELEQNNIQLEHCIADADHNWHDNVKERFFGNSIASVRQSHSVQMNAMDVVISAFESGENDIFSLI